MSSVEQRAEWREKNRLWRERTRDRFLCDECGSSCPSKQRYPKRRVVCMACHRRSGAERKALRLQRRAEETAARIAARPPGRTREETRAAQKAWRAAHPGYMREWKRRHPEERRRDRRNRRIAKREQLVAALTAAQNGRCAYCRDRLGAEFHVDHIVPRAAGGGNERSNLQLTCAECNLAKGARDPVEFAQSLGKLV